MDKHISKHSSLQFSKLSPQTVSRQALDRALKTNLLGATKVDASARVFETILVVLANRGVLGLRKHRCLPLTGAKMKTHQSQVI